MVRLSRCRGRPWRRLPHSTHLDLVDMQPRDGRSKEIAPRLTDVLATVGKTTAAGVRNFVTADRTFVAGDIDNLDDIGIGLISAHSEL